MKYLPDPTDKQIKAFQKKVSQIRDCHMWVGSTMPSSDRGAVFLNGGQYSAPRVAYLIYKGIDPVGYNVLHTCKNSACVNPDHLYLSDKVGR